MPLRTHALVILIIACAATMFVQYRTVDAQQTNRRPSLADRLNALRNSVLGSDDSDDDALDESDPARARSATRETSRSSSGRRAIERTQSGQPSNQTAPRGTSARLQQHESSQFPVAAGERGVIVERSDLQAADPVVSAQRYTTAARPSESRLPSRELGDVRATTIVTDAPSTASGVRQSPTARRVETANGLVRPTRDSIQSQDTPSQIIVEEVTRDPGVLPREFATASSTAGTAMDNASSKTSKASVANEPTQVLRQTQVIAGPARVAHDVNAELRRPDTDSSPRRRAPILIGAPSVEEDRLESVATQATRPSNLRHQAAATNTSANPVSNAESEKVRRIRVRSIGEGLAETPNPEQTPTRSVSPLEPAQKPVLAQRTAPTISSRFVGPEQITIGREAEYELTVYNSGDVVADRVIAEIRIPNTAKLVSTDATLGEVSNINGAIEWSLRDLVGDSSANLKLRIVPQSSDAMALDTSVRLAPIAQKSVIEVQEPRLEVVLRGPEDVLHGKPQVYQLEVSNPGTGVAENVVLHLLPPGADPSEMNHHEVGSLAAGATESFDVELIAHHAGAMRVEASATGSGGLVSKVEKDVLVRRPQLTMESRCSEESYAGADATYVYRVRNVGTADAENTSIAIQLPPEAELVDATDGHEIDASANAVQWNVGTIATGDDVVVELRCTLNKPGENETVALVETADHELDLREANSTRVIALADLKLEVSDPSGPVAVGEEAVYEIRVRNRGAATAESIQIVALFSNGIDPTSIQGVEHTVNNGRVAFHPIDRLAPNSEISLQIRAVAKSAGTHVFRAEVLCSEIGTKLSMEETTLYFDSGLGGGRISTARRTSGGEKR